MREFVVDLTGVTTTDGFVAAFNECFCHHAGGHLHSLNWDAFSDLLSWPDEVQYRLVFRNWSRVRGVSRRLAARCSATTRTLRLSSPARVKVMHLTAAACSVSAASRPARRPPDALRKNQWGCTHDPQGGLGCDEPS
jgi:hypothetical protein